MDSFDETDLFGGDQLLMPYSYHESRSPFRPRDAEIGPDQDPNTLTASFSEADLIPDPSFGGISYVNRSRGSAGKEDDSDDEAVLPTFVYALDEHDYEGSKLAFSKTLLVSQQQDNRARAKSLAKEETRSLSDRKSHRLSRSFASVGQKSRPVSRRYSLGRKSLKDDVDTDLKSSASSSKADTPGEVDTAASSNVSEQGGEHKASKRASRRQSMMATWKRDISSSGSPASGSSSTPISAGSLIRSKSRRSERSISKSNGQPQPRNKFGTSSSTQTLEGPVAPANLYFHPNDELAPGFRTIELEYQKLDSKPTTAKTAAVRSSLVPFLKKTVAHRSNKRLRPEYLDRRVKILSCWWVAMLDMLRGKDKQSVSAVDRLTLLEAITLVMERAEWRAPPSPFCSLVDRIAFAKATGRDIEADAPTQADDLDFVLEAVSHDVKNTFVQNLFLQVVFVVERMSQRNAPTNLVKFCGKTCAYAFLFCPSVAEVLIRHWKLSPHSISKTFDAYGLDDPAALNQTSERVQRLFPQCVEELAFKSVRQTIATLKKRPILPLGLERLKSHGLWSSRWSGKESDLFFIFVEHYHRLAAEFMPQNVTRLEMACVPGSVLVHVQLLAVLESVLGSQNRDEPARASKATTFDDVLASEGQALSSDGLAALLAKASKSMTENSLVILLRTFLLNAAAPQNGAIKLFTQGFCAALKAATQSTSLYNQTACFTLLDFLQETFIIFIQFESTTSAQGSLLDWPFWVEAFKKMVSSENTMTEMRLFSFIFTMWDYLEKDLTAKELLSLDFILDENVFYTRFNHWCPLVRAFYQRLLCWRLARFDGDITEKNLSVYTTLMDRLLVVWSHHKFLLETAEANGTRLPPTAPCNPAPGRRLLIIRTDLMSDGKPETANSVPQRQSSLAVGPGKAAPSAKFPSTNGESVKNEPAKKRTSGIWSLIGNRATGEEGSFPLSSTSSDGKQNGSPPPEDQNSRESLYNSRPAQAGLATSSTNGKRGNHKVPPGVLATPSNANANQIATFKFSMEYVGTRPHASLVQVSLTPPKIPLPALSCLRDQFELVEDVPAAKPPRAYEGSTRYSGRALAEWALLVTEFQNFFDRRRKEGVLLSKNIETPSLSVDPLRRPG